MTSRFKGLIATFAIGVIGLASSARALAQPNVSSLTGTWTMGLIGDHVIPMGLSLQQTGTALTGTLTMMGKDMPVKGEVVNGAITFTAAGNMMMRQHAPDAGNAAPAPSPAAIPMKFTGKVMEDGTLSGEIATPRGAMKWTADRLKERATPKTAGDVRPMLGSWTLAVKAEQEIPGTFRVEADGSSARGVLAMMGADIPLKGDLTAGAFTFAGDIADDVAAKLGMKGTVKLTGALKEDGTLSGQLTVPHGTFPVTGARTKEPAPAGHTK